MNSLLISAFIFFFFTNKQNVAKAALKLDLTSVLKHNIQKLMKHN